MFIINIYNQTYNARDRAAALRYLEEVGRRLGVATRHLDVAESRGQVRFYFLDDVGMAHPVTIRYGL